MSERDVAAFTRAFKAGTRFDAEALIEECDPEVEWYLALLGALAGDATVYRGHEGVRELIDDFAEAFAESHMEFPDVRDLGDRIVAIGVLRNRGKASRAEVETPLAYVVDFRDGKMIRVRSYLDHREALEAAGLRE